MHISAYIKEIRYNPILCSALIEYNTLESVLNTSSSILNISNNKLAVSRWVSPKRTRSYPYQRIYDTLGFVGKKVTIIPVMKDEGKDGDRDFIQWDTISLMSLLDIYVIIAYYSGAEKNDRYENKITNQTFDIKYIESQVGNILSYHSSALHWNIKQAEHIPDLLDKALFYYEKIYKLSGVFFHGNKSVAKRIDKIKDSLDSFIAHSRDLAEQAQHREQMTIQPKENVVEGKKASITIKNYLGGNYYLTADEAYIENDTINIIEAKHSKSGTPSISDIKDGLIKMILFSNLSDVYVENNLYKVKPILKITGQNINHQTPSILALKEEAKINNFYLEF